MLRKSLTVVGAGSQAVAAGFRHTDVQMPGLSGLDLQDRLIARGHCIPIIFMTGYPNEYVRARAMKAGAVCFLNKPFSLDHFIGCIEKALKAA
jgi:FixJ family two-component response regulator